MAVKFAVYGLLNKNTNKFLHIFFKRLVELNAATEFSLESLWLDARHEQANGFFRVLRAKIATTNTFKTLEEIGAVGCDSGIGIGDLHGHR